MRCLLDDVSDAGHSPYVTDLTLELGIPLETGELFGAATQIVRIFRALDHGVARRDFVSGLNVVAYLDARLMVVVDSSCVNGCGFQAPLLFQFRCTIQDGWRCKVRDTMHDAESMPLRPCRGLLNLEMFMIVFIRCNLLRFCMLAALAVGLSRGQEKPVQKAPETPSTPSSGAELYKQHCVVCHGNDLKGSGPFPPPYRRPPDLTTLSRRHGGKFPEAYASNVLRNGVKLPAHGPAEMPVWGVEFEATNGVDKTQVESRIRNLTNYIKSRQSK